MTAEILDWTISVTDILLVGLGGVSANAATRSAALRRLHVEKRVEVLAWAIARESQNIFGEEGVEGVEMNVERDGRRPGNPWSVFELFEDTVNMLPWLDRLTFQRLEHWVTKGRDTEAGDRPFTWRDYTHFAQMRLRTSPLARLSVLRIRVDTYRWLLTRTGERLRNRRRWSRLQSDMPGRAQRP